MPVAPQRGIELLRLKLGAPLPVFPLRGIAQAIGMPAPELMATQGQPKAHGAPASAGAPEPPADTAKRLGRRFEPDPVPLPLRARCPPPMRQLEKWGMAIRRVDGDRDRKIRAVAAVGNGGFAPQSEAQANGLERACPKGNRGRAFVAWPAASARSGTAHCRSPIFLEHVANVLFFSIFRESFRPDPGSEAA